MIRHALLLCLVLATAACQLPTVGSSAPHGDVATPADKPHAEPAVLYARNGKPVDDSTPNRSAAGGKDSQANGGRLTILELYQKTLDERDALVRDLDVARAELDKTRGALADSQKKVEELKSHDASDTQEVDRLKAENLELAARLATAHIRRMEAEKQLLELKLEVARAKAADAQSAKPGDSKGDNKPEGKK